MIGSHRKPMADSTGGGRGRSLLGGGLAKKRRMGSALFGARTGSGRPLESDTPAESEGPLDSEAPIDSEAPLESDAPRESAPVASEPLESEAPRESTPLASDAPLDSTPVEKHRVSEPSESPGVTVDGAAFVAAIAASVEEEAPASHAPALEIEARGPALTRDPPSVGDVPSDPPSWSEFDMLSIADDPSYDDVVAIPTPQPEAATPASRPAGRGRWIAAAVVLVIAGGLAAYGWFQMRPSPAQGHDAATVAP